mgnify:CR=1 FL=1
MAFRKAKSKNIKKRRKAKKKQKFSFAKHIIFPIFLISFLFGTWHYRHAIYYLIYQRIDKKENVKVSKLTTQLRIFDVLQHHDDKTFGIDIFLISEN